jgi:hypothetical protein
MENEFIGDQVVINVTVANRDDEARALNLSDWKLQNEGGQVVDPFTGENAMSSGDLVEGGTVTGAIAFDQSDPGTYYVIYKPDAFDAARGIWRVTL